MTLSLVKIRSSWLIVTMLMFTQHTKFIIFLCGFSIILNMIPKWHHPPLPLLSPILSTWLSSMNTICCQYYLVNTIYWQQVLFTTDVFPSGYGLPLMFVWWILSTNNFFLASTVFCWCFFRKYHLLSIFFKRMLFITDIFVSYDLV